MINGIGISEYLNVIFIGYIVSCLQGHLYDVPDGKEVELVFDDWHEST